MKACMDCGEPTGRGVQAMRCLVCFKAKKKAYKQTPEYKAYHKAYCQTAEHKARTQTPEYKAYEKARSQTPERKAYKQTPEYKASQNAYQQTPKNKAYRKTYYQTPEAKARNAMMYVLYGGSRGSITTIPVELKEAAAAIVAIRVLVKERNNAQP